MLHKCSLCQKKRQAPHRSGSLFLQTIQGSLPHFSGYFILFLHFIRTPPPQTLAALPKTGHPIRNTLPCLFLLRVCHSPKCFYLLILRISCLPLTRLSLMRIKADNLVLSGRSVLNE
jgi:hypothetical protein